MPENPDRKRILITTPGMNDPAWVGRVSAYNAPRSVKYQDLMALQEAMAPLQRQRLEDPDRLNEALASGMRLGPLATALRTMAHTDGRVFEEEDEIAFDPWVPDEVWLLFEPDVRDDQDPTQPDLHIPPFGAMSDRVKLAQAYLPILVGKPFAVVPKDFRMSLQNWEPCFRSLRDTIGPILDDTLQSSSQLGLMEQEDIDLANELDDILGLDKGLVEAEVMDKSEKKDLARADLRFLIGPGTMSMRMALLFTYLEVRHTGASLWYGIDQQGAVERSTLRKLPLGAFPAQFGGTGLPDVILRQQAQQEVQKIRSLYAAAQERLTARITVLEGELALASFATPNEIPAKATVDQARMGIIQSLVDRIVEESPSIKQSELEARVCELANDPKAKTANTIRSYFQKGYISRPKA